MDGARQHERWVIVLAGGNGTRLSALTTQHDGTVVPKQYCSLRGGRSLLGDTLARASSLAPRERILVVVAQEHARFWQREFADASGYRLIVQPRNRGTAAGVLLPLLATLRLDPGAQVTLLPSDHFVGDEAALATDLRAAQDAAAAAPDRVLLLGIAPDAPEPDYGWILPGPGSAPTRPVAAFHEKPSRPQAADLLARGAVWNAFLLVGSGRTLLDLYARRLPRLLDAFQAALPDRLGALYDELGNDDFSRDLLAGSEPHLGLRLARPCDWTDLGTPERVRACAARHPRATLAIRPAPALAAAPTAPGGG